MDDIITGSIADMQTHLSAGHISARELLQAYLDRIAALDRAGPRLHAVIETNDDALVIAEALDRERAWPVARHSDPDQR